MNNLLALTQLVNFLKALFTNSFTLLIELLVYDKFE